MIAVLYIREFEEWGVLFISTTCSAIYYINGLFYATIELPQQSYIFSSEILLIAYNLAYWSTATKILLFGNNLVFGVCFVMCKTDRDMVFEIIFVFRKP